MQKATTLSCVFTLDVYLKLHAYCKTLVLTLIISMKLFTITMALSFSELLRLVGPH